MKSDARKMDASKLFCWMQIQTEQHWRVALHSILGSLSPLASLPGHNIISVAARVSAPPSVNVY